MQRFFSSISELFPLTGKLEKVLVITGTTSYADSGARDVLKPLLEKYESKHYSVTQLNPELSEIDKVIGLCARFKPDVVIAIGGGSVMDVAKAARFLAFQNEGSKNIVINGIDNVAKPTARLVAVPTTAGSGAESTHFAVIYKSGTKYSLAHEFVKPDDVVLDERLIKSAPKKVAAAGAMDALAQAIESYWSVRSTKTSRILSIKALRLILANIESSIHAPTAKTRQAMLQGANLAGQAIDLAFTTAPHALSYVFTVRFRMSHGEAVGLTLPDFIRFNAALDRTDCNDIRGVDFVRERFKELLQVFDQPDIERLASRVEELRASIGLAESVRTEHLGQTIEGIVESVNQQRLSNNPRIVTVETMTDIVQKIILE